jgi:hypothetical protein
MFDSQCDLAALVYDRDQDPDGVLRDFAADLGRRGYRAVGLIQHGHHCVDAKLTAMLLHSGEELQLFQDLGACATRDNGAAVAPRDNGAAVAPGDNGAAVARGCRLDLGRQRRCRGGERHRSGRRPRDRHRFGRQEREGKSLSYLIERALSADIPVVIAVPSHRFQDWIRFAEGMSVKLHCDPHALNAWWDRSPSEMAASSGNTKASAKRSSNRHMLSGALALSKTWRGRTISPQHQTCRLRDTA